MRNSPAFVVVLALVAALVFAAAPPALADGPGGPFDINMNTMSELPERNGWGVSDKDPNAEHNFPNLVWDFAQIGDNMYVAGSFLKVQGPNSTQEYNQPYLAAFNIHTGVWDASFLPDLDGAVFALEVSPDGFLIAGGQFSSLNGIANTSGLVGINPVTGDKALSFQASVERPFAPNEPAIVRSLEVVGNDLYVAGNFNFIRGNSDAQRTQMYNLTRINALFGTPDSGWQPNIAGGGVWGFGIDVARNRIHFGGINIETVNGQAVNRMGTVYLDTGANVPGQTPFEFNYTLSQRDIWDIEVAGGRVWVAGEQHTLSILNGNTRTREAFHSTGLRGNTFLPYPGAFAGGAFQLAEHMGDWIIAGCHCTYEWRSTNSFTGNSWYDSVSNVRRPVKIAGAIDVVTGAALNWSPDLATSEEGAWAAHSDTNGCLWLGGDFGLGGLEAGATFWLGGMARFCSPGVANASTMSCTATTLDNGSVLVAWPRFGANGYDVSHDGGPPSWHTGYSFVDTSPGTNYTVTAYGNGETSNCVVDAHVPGTFTCSVTQNAAGQTVISWPNVGASGHDLSRDGGTPIFVAGTSYVDLTPGTSYAVEAFNNGVPVATGNCTNADDDFDDDGAPNSVENTGGQNDQDGDGVLNRFDLDSDNDSIPDVIELGLQDADGNYRVDSPGLAGSVINPPNADGDALPDYLDLESTNPANNGTAYDLAGTPYAPLDTNGDGRVDAGDANGGTDANGNGIDDAVEAAPPIGFSCTVTNNANGSATIAWTDLGANGYDLAQDGGSASWITATSFNDFTPGTDYTITAWGNGVGGTTTSCTNPNPGGGGWDCSVVNNPNGSVTISWPDIGASGYDLVQDTEPAIWRTTASFDDFTPGTDYTITAWGGGVGGTTTSCTNPNPGGGGWSCSITNNIDNTITITWPDIGANGYDVSHDGEAPRWVTGTVWVDDTPGSVYTVTAWGGGVGGTTTQCLA